jgi:hypothetical protein
MLMIRHRPGVEYAMRDGIEAVHRPTFEKEDGSSCVLGQSGGENGSGRSSTNHNHVGMYYRVGHVAPPTG